MNRRNLLKSAGLGLGTLISLPNWAQGWRADSLQNQQLFSTSNTSLLAELVDTIIPESDTPGAKSLGVAQLITKIVADCHGAAAFTKFENNLSLLDTYAKSKTASNFEALNPSQRLAFLTDSLNNGPSDIQIFIKQLKQLTIMGYQNSEYVMTNIAKFEWAPARYLGCVKV